MGRDPKTGEPLQQPDGLTAMSDPVEAHGDQVDAGGLDLASLVHSLAKTICEELGRPCGCQANLPEGLCIATSDPCPYVVAASGKPYATDAAKANLKADAKARADAAGIGGVGGFGK